MKCPFCESDTDYKTIGNHWRQSCGYPEPDHMIEVFDGILMGDGNLKKNSNPDMREGNQSLEINSTNQTFLWYLYDEFDPYFTEPKLRISAEESAKKSINGNTISTPDGAVFRDQYRVITRSIPFFNRYDSWDEDSGKRWPRSIELTPTRMKYVYCADGGLSWNKETESARSQITSSNEPEQLYRMNELLDSMSIESSVYDDRIMLKPSSTDKFLDWMGDPIPGFEYKWENSSLDNYERLYQNAYYKDDSTYEI